MCALTQVYYHSRMYEAREIGALHKFHATEARRSPVGGGARVVPARDLGSCLQASSVLPGKAGLFESVDATHID